MGNARGAVEWRVDVTGLHCPMPVIRCRATLARMMVGDVLRLRATDRDAHREIASLVAQFGHQLLAVHAGADAVEFVIRKQVSMRGAGRRVSQTLSWRACLMERLAGFAPVPICGGVNAAIISISLFSVPPSAVSCRR